MEKYERDGINAIVEKTLNNEKVTAGEFFRCTANLNDCDIFTRINTKVARDKVYAALKEVVPEICERYWSYKAILIAIKKSLENQEARIRFEEQEKDREKEVFLKEKKSALERIIERIDNIFSRKKPNEKKLIASQDNKLSALTNLILKIEAVFTKMPERMKKKELKKLEENSVA